MADNYGYGNSGYQGYGGYGSPTSSTDIRNRLALAMLQNGTDTSPIRSPWQGAARLSQALFGTLALNRQQNQENLARQQGAGIQQGIYGALGGGNFYNAPGAGASAPAPQVSPAPPVPSPALSSGGDAVRSALDAGSALEQPSLPGYGAGAARPVNPAPSPLPPADPMIRNAPYMSSADPGAGGAAVASMDPSVGLPPMQGGGSIFDSLRNLSANPAATPAPMPSPNLSANPASRPAPMPNYNLSPNPGATPAPMPGGSPAGQQGGNGAPDFYSAAAMHESGMRNIPNAAGGAAGGYFQFMPQTWKGVASQHPELGLPGSPLQASYGQQLAAYKALTGQNAATLSAAGIPVNDKNVFMSSFLGGGGATKFIGAMGQNPNAPAAQLFPLEARYNPDVFFDRQTGQPRSLGQVYGMMTQTFGSGNTTGYGGPQTATGGQFAGPGALPLGYAGPGPGAMVNSYSGLSAAAPATGAINSAAGPGAGLGGSAAPPPGAGQPAPFWRGAQNAPITMGNFGGGSGGATSAGGAGAAPAVNPPVPPIPVNPQAPPLNPPLPPPRP